MYSLSTCITWHNCDQHERDGIILLQLKQLQTENENLMGIHSKHSQEMQEECIDLPNNLDASFLLFICVAVLT